MMDEKVEMQDIIARRQTLPAGQAGDTENNEYEIYDYLTLYGPGGDVVKRSLAHGFQTRITMTYRGIKFIAEPGCDTDVYITWNSLMKFVNENDKEGE